MLDDKDRKILEILQEHSEYTTRQIAKKTLLPITTVHNRIRKLRKQKVIKKYTIIPDYDKVGKGFVVYLLITADLKYLKKQKKTQYDLAKTLRSFYFIERVDIVSGGTDMVAIIRVKDVPEFDKVLFTKIQTIDGISKTQSLIVIHQG
ncbi:TPA: Lrp/AsnC family transcriptional regulator [Candidatus Woesearchaeota archaeon]|nr:hypothetical protein [archaeon]HIJ11069.1 Lrp/AsnC family transcriptional regulator [Candidatus Woesearchaeota archaeon]|tara:strand:- start:791 stop:1234 length:444 start_codon:yes stop_codon:yes gene_type:complete